MVSLKLTVHQAGCVKGQAGQEGHQNKNESKGIEYHDQNYILYEIIVQVILLLGFLTSTFALKVDEDYDVSSRNPYSYKYNVDDPEKETSFQVSLRC